MEFSFKNIFMYIYNFGLQKLWFFFSYIHVSFKHLRLSCPVEQRSLSRCPSHPGTCWLLWWLVHFVKACLHNHFCAKKKPKWGQFMWFKEKVKLLYPQFCTKATWGTEDALLVMKRHDVVASTSFLRVISFTCVWEEGFPWCRSSIVPKELRQPDLLKHVFGFVKCRGRCCMICSLQIMTKSTRYHQYLIFSKQRNNLPINHFVIWVI